MCSLSERLGYIYSLLHRVPCILDHTTAFGQLMLFLLHQLLHVVSRDNVQQILHQQANESPRAVCCLKKAFVVRNLWELPFVVCGHNPVKDFQISHLHGKPQQVQGDNFGPCSFCQRCLDFIPTRV
jgi:hypothetical protein